VQIPWGKALPLATSSDKGLPLTEEIRLKLFASPDLSVFLIDLWVSGTPFTQLKLCLKLWGLHSKRFWYVRRLPWKVVEYFGSRDYFLRPWFLRRLPLGKTTSLEKGNFPIMKQNPSRRANSQGNFLWQLRQTKVYLSGRGLPRRPVLREGSSVLLGKSHVK